MTDPAPPLPLVFDAPVLLRGGGPAPAGLVAELRARSGAVVAADGGADLLPPDLLPDAVIGDMDSVADPAAWRARIGGRFLHEPEQESTDLGKCLRLTRAPLYLCAGFLGGRLDHSLAALHVLLTHPDRRILLAGEEDLAFLAPLRWRARLEAGARVSIFPLASCTGLASAGLEWPLDRLALGPGERIGTSNRAVATEVGLDLDRRAAVVMVERRFLDPVIASLDEAV